MSASDIVDVSLGAVALVLPSWTDEGVSAAADDGIKTKREWEKKASVGATACRSDVASRAKRRIMLMR